MTATSGAKDAPAVTATPGAKDAPVVTATPGAKDAPAVTATSGAKDAAAATVTSDRRETHIPDVELAAAVAVAVIRDVTGPPTTAKRYHAPAGHIHKCSAGGQYSGGN